jgi:hypothetical protein
MAIAMPKSTNNKAESNPITETYHPTRKKSPTNNSTHVRLMANGWVIWRGRILYARTEDIKDCGWRNFS